MLSCRLLGDTKAIFAQVVIKTTELTLRQNYKEKCCAQLYLSRYNTHRFGTLGALSAPKLHEMLRPAATWKLLFFDFFKNSAIAAKCAKWRGSTSTLCCTLSWY